MWASAHTGEKARDVIAHWKQAFAILGILSAVKTDNGPAYASQQEKFDEIPAEVENVVNPVVWASDIPGRSKRAEPTIKEVYSSRSDLKDVPLENPD
ncbi:hypothetical protein DUI87_01583 [Hirundo rustica rustica]|uniref:Integrase catalytic domain-containing protein n=1 Tax=Hirundo rustica rustica TaxID=333673 RepID=A0A3M0L6J2_HIRRU|nr:hypothetical protein DUI87_01583 [Hirundo rustica rustica]